MRRHVTVLGCLSVLSGLLACDDAAQGASDVIVLSDVDPAPCRVVGVDWDAVIRGTPEPGPNPDPVTIEAGPGPLFYTGSGNGGIGVWSPSGEPLGTIGQRGQGPGEIDSGSLIDSEVGRDGTVNVFTWNGWWYRYGPDGSFIGRASSPHLGIPMYSRLAANGNVIVTGFGREHQFRVIDAQGNLVSAFGELPPVVAGSPGEGGHLIPHPMSRQRQIAPTASSTFWAAPFVGSPDGYRLEEWTLDGELVRAIERDAEWFPEPWPYDPSGPRPPRISIDMDGNDLLWVFVFLYSPENNEVDDLRVEVLDPATRSILASERLEYGDVAGSFSRLLPGTRLYARPSLDSLGFQEYHLGNVELLPSGPDSDSCR